MQNFDKWVPGIIGWLGGLVVASWVFQTVFPRANWKLESYSAHFKQRLRRHLPKWLGPRHHHRSDSAMEWLVSTAADSVYLKKVKGAWSIFVLEFVVAAGFGGGAVVWLLLSGYMLKHGTSEGIWPLLLTSFAFLICTGLFTLLCWVLSSEAISSIRFQPAEQRTIVSYLGIIRRTIPSLPSKIELGRGTVGSGFARLIFPGRKFHISLFCTAKGSFDTSSPAIQYALKETAQLRESLHLEVKEIG